jgi:hypothetical protein
MGFFVGYQLRIIRGTPGRMLKKAAQQGRDE